MAVPTLQRLASAFVHQYVHRVPIQRGKWRLVRWALPFLVVRLEDGLYVRVSEEGDSAGMHLLWSGMREPATMRLFKDVVQPGMTVFDAGANIGEFTLVAARRVGREGRVHAFEPTPRVGELLRANVALNGLDNVVINPVALTDAPGDVPLYYDPMLPDSNSIVGLSHARGVMTVPATTLDEYAQHAGVTTVDVLKMDVEGAEVLALRGAARLLSSAHAPLIVVEAHDGTLARSGRTSRDLIELLQGQGYTCGVIDRHGETSTYANVLAAKPPHVQRFAAVQRILARSPV